MDDDDVDTILDDVMSDVEFSESDNPDSPTDESGRTADTVGVDRAVTHELQDADFSAIEREIESIFDSVRDDLADLRDRAIQHPDEVLELGEFDKNPIIEILNKANRQVEGVLLISKISPAVIEQVTEVHKNGAQRVSELFDTYEAGELRAKHGLTPEETLFEKVIETTNPIERSTLAVVKDAMDG